jgi:hypothetical protein
MEVNKFYTDITNSVKEIFSFLQSEFHFSEFEHQQLAYEIHLVAKNEFATIDIWFEATPSTPIWAKINDYYIDNLELKNQVIEDYKTELQENYDYLFKQYLKTNKNTFLDKISKKYMINGQRINDKYLKEISNIIQRHNNILSGDIELLKSNTDIIINNNKLIKDNERIEAGIYTIEYQYFSKDEYDMYEEFKKISEIKSYLSERPEIKVYRVLDCYMNEIDLQLLE